MNVRNRKCPHVYMTSTQTIQKRGRRIHLLSDCTFVQFNCVWSQLREWPHYTYVLQQVYVYLEQFAYTHAYISFKHTHTFLPLLDGRARKAKSHAATHV